MKKKFLNLLMIFLVGGVAGILGCQFLLPWLGGLPGFNKIDWLRRSREGITVINQTQRVVITENQALEEAIQKVSGAVVGVFAQRTEKEILKKVSGLIVSSDGLVLTADDLIVKGTQKIFVVLGEKKVQAEIKKRDKNSGLALLKISENNLPVLPFFDGELKLGERLFLVGARIQNPASSTPTTKFVDLGLVKQISPDLVVDFLSQEILGNSLFNIKGEVVGINLVDKENQPKIVLSATLRQLLK